MVDWMQRYCDPINPRLAAPFVAQVGRNRWRVATNGQHLVAVAAEDHALQIESPDIPVAWFASTPRRFNLAKLRRILGPGPLSMNRGYSERGTIEIDEAKYDQSRLAFALSHWRRGAVGVTTLEAMGVTGLQEHLPGKILRVCGDGWRVVLMSLRYDAPAPLSQWRTHD